MTKPDFASVADIAQRVGGVVRAETSSPGAATVRDATHDSRQVEPGWLYCAVPGASVDGHDFAAQAVERGACALLVERKLPLAVDQIVVDDVRSALGPAASLIHGDPSHELTIVGITGTNGKSSTVQLLADIWSKVGIRAEIVGTLAGARTTPEATDLQRIFRAARNRRVEALAIEVSSHALVMGRVAATRFAAAVFTNLTQDHLDFHHTMEAYFEAKASLFHPDFTSLGVINSDDPYGRRLIDAGPGIGSGITLHPFSIQDAEDLSFDGVISRFHWRGHQINLQLAGAHNVSNAMAAARVAELLQINAVDIADALCATSPVRGRFEMVDAGQPFPIAVDYAHTPDALRAALRTARQVVKDGRVIVVFGCGGDRDSDKRAEMGDVVEQMADVAVLTSDNPRSEDPQRIIDEILEGMEHSDRVSVYIDRQEAINSAIGSADSGDLVLIAGKGHETYQIIGDQTHHFDDREAALRALGVIA